MIFYILSFLFTIRLSKEFLKLFHSIKNELNLWSLVKINSFLSVSQNFLKLFQLI